MAWPVCLIRREFLSSRFPTCSIDRAESFRYDYHEHLSYHSVKPLVSFMQRHGLELVRVQRVDSHGGSIRCYAAPAGSRAIDPSVAAATRRRRRPVCMRRPHHGLSGPDQPTGAELRSLIGRFAQGGSKVAGFGAPAKATTLMYQFASTRRISTSSSTQPAETRALQSGPLCAGHRFFGSQ